MYLKKSILGLVLIFILPLMAGNCLANCGDIDGSGAINILDASFLISHLYRGGPAPLNSTDADIDCSGLVNLLDITRTIDYLYNNGGEPCPSSCEIPEGQDYLFDISYVNYAWGYRMNGYVIDREGNVSSYDHSDAEWLPSSDQYYTQAELDEKFSQNLTLIGTVELTILLDRFARLSVAEEGPLSPGVNVCYDAGTSTYMGYRYDSDTQHYIPIVLYMAGDTARKNFNDQAKYLFDWLLEIIDYQGDISCGYPE